MQEFEFVDIRDSEDEECPFTYLDEKNGVKRLENIAVFESEDDYNVVSVDYDELYVDKSCPVAAHLDEDEITLYKLRIKDENGGCVYVIMPDMCFSAYQIFADEDGNFYWDYEGEEEDFEEEEEDED